MARPREFDMNEALDAAMVTFWTHGFEATSMADLVAATGLHKGSLYKAFDDKHDLFMKSLKHYLDGAYRDTREALAVGATPLDRLRGWLHGFVALCSDQPVQRGCMAMNSAVELGPHDAAVRDLLQQHHARSSELVVETIRDGQRHGQLSNDLDAEQIAGMLFVIGVGLLATSKAMGDRIDAEGMLASTLSLVTTDPVGHRTGD